MNKKYYKRRFILEKDAFPSLPLLMLITLGALRDLGGSASIHELSDHIIEVESISEKEQSYMMPNGRYPRFQYYLSWSRTYLKRAGALENSSRGIWSLTEKGEKVISLEDVQSCYEAVLEEEKLRAKIKREEAKAQQGEGQRSKEQKTDIKDEKCVVATEELIEASEEDQVGWREQLLSELMKMSPSSFERLAQRLLREAGFVKVEVRGKTGDGGLDGVGVLRVNLVSFQVYFQCKRWSGSVGSKEIRDFRGALQGRADKGLFITTSSFTKQASDEASRDGAIAIDLIDGERLGDLLKQYGLGVKTEMVEHVSVLGEWLREI